MNTMLQALSDGGAAEQIADSFVATREDVWRPRQRRAVLVHLIPPNTGALTVARQECDGEALFSEIRTGGGEGIVAKRLEAPYHPGRRSPDWLKIKCLKRQDFAVIGWHQDDQARLQSLVLGTYSADGRHHPPRMIRRR